MAITRYAGDRFTTNTSDTKPTGVLDGAYLIDTGNLTQYVRRSVGGTAQWAQLAGGGGGGTPGGATTQVQFNDAGSFGGSTGLTFDGQRLYANNFQLSGTFYDSNTWAGENGMVLTNEGATGVNWKSIESVLSGVGGSGVANYVARWSDEDTLTSGTIYDNGDVGIGTANPGARLHVFDTVISDLVILESSGPSAADGPDVVFYRNSASPADSDDLGKLAFRGRNDNSQDVNYANIIAEAIDVSDGAEGGALNFNTYDVGTSATRMVITGANVGIGTNSPSHRLQVLGPTTGGWNGLNLNVVISSSNTYSNGHAGGIAFGGAYNSSETQTVLAGVWASRPNAGDGQYAGMVHIGGREHGTSNIPQVLTVTHAKVGIGTNAPYYNLDLRFDNSDTSFSGGSGGNWGGNGLRIENDNTTVGSMALVQFRTATADWFIGNKFIQSTPDKSDFIFNHEDSEKVRITNDGNVGIGTNNPTLPLHIYRASGNVYAKVQNGSTSQAALQLQTATTDGNWVMYIPSNSTNLRFYRGADKVTLTADGSLGIGTTAPAKLLTVESTSSPIIGIYSTYADAAARNWAISTNNAAYGDFTISNSAANGGNPNAIKLSILKDGNVGIGTNAPGSALGSMTGGGSTGLLEITQGGTEHGILALSKTTTTNDDEVGILIFSNTDNANSGAGSRPAVAGIVGSIYTDDSNAGDDSGGNLEFWTKPLATGEWVERMRITHGGNVGIGTTNPGSAKLMVNPPTRNAGTATQQQAGYFIGTKTAYGGSGNKGLWQNQLHVADDSALAAGIGGAITFGATQDNTNGTYLASIEGSRDNATSAEYGGSMIFRTRTNGSAVMGAHMVIASDGNVGIGTTAPAKLFELYSTSHAEMIINTTSNTSNCSIDFDLSGTRKGIIRYDHNATDADGKFEFYVGGNTSTQRMVIMGDGKVGIGTNDPAFTLHVNHTNGGPIGLTRTSGSTTGVLGNIWFGNTDVDSTIANIRGVQDGATDSAKLVFQTEATGGSLTERMEIKSTGQIQLNSYGSGTYTGTPAYKLSVDSSGNIIETAVGSGQVDGSGTANTIPRWTDSDTIGDSIITVPSNTSVQVAGPLTATGNITVGPSNDSKIYMGGNDYIAFTDGVGDGFKFVYDNTERLRITNTGNVGVGVTDPDAKLEIKGAAGSTGLTFKTTDSSSNNTFWIEDGGTAGFHYYPFMINQDNSDTDCPASTFFYVHHATAPFIIKNDGKVGVGTTNPQYPLEVYGDATLNSSSATTDVTLRWEAAGATKWRIKNDTEVTDGTDHTLTFTSAGDANISINQAGNVGIGTAIPKAPAHIYSSGTTNTPHILLCLGSNTSNSPHLLFSENINAAFNSGMSIGYRGDYGSGGDNALNIQGIGADATTVGTAIATFKSGGKVGIGTTDPNSRVDVLTASRSTAFSAGDGATWHDLIVRNPDNTQNAAVGLAFELNATYHANAAAGIAAVKEYSSSDYAAGLAFVTRPNAAVAEERVRITYDGKVGIGTNAPSEPLHVRSTSGAAAIFERSDAASVGIRILGSGMTTSTCPKIHAEAGPDLAFTVNNAERMRILDTGSVGIGTDAPSAALDVVVSSTVWAAKINQTNASNGDGLFVNTGSTASADYVVSFRADSANIFDVKADGKVGIGTATPSSLLTLQSSVAGAVDIFAIKADDGGNLYRVGKDGSDHGYIELFDGASTPIKVRFNSAGASYFNGGNVGIGRATPATHLEVYQSSTTAPTLLQITNYSAGDSYLNWVERDDTGEAANAKFGEAGVYGFQLGYDGGDNKLYLTSGNQTSIANRLTVQRDDGNVGIGTVTPSELFQVNGNMILRGGTNHRYKIANDSNNNWAEIGNDGATGENTLEFFTGSSSVPSMSITNGKKVGIGTAAPAYTLQANGTNGGIMGVTRTTGTTTGILGHVRFGNTDVDSDLANIEGVQDGATDSARLEFQTQATGGAATTRLTIKSDGVVDINSAKLKINGGSGTDGQVLTTDGAGGIAWETSPGAGSVDGSGTANYVPKWTDSDTIGDSLIYSGTSNVGIGVAAPSVLLDVAKSSPSADNDFTNNNNPGSNQAGSIAIRNTRFAVGEYASLTINAANSSSVQGASIIAQSHANAGSAANLIFALRGASSTDEKMRIQYNGQVLINATSTGGWTNELYVNGKVYATEYDLPSGASLDWANGDARITEGLTSNYSLSLQTYDGSSAMVTNMFLASGGSVGVGTNAPTRLFHVYGGSDYNMRLTSADTRSGLVLDKPGTTTIMGSALLLASDETYRLGTASYYHVVMNQAGRTQLFGGGSAGLTVDTSQDVGIGTVTPGARLHVYDTVVSDLAVFESIGTSAADGPDIVLYRNSASPADSDDLGKIFFRGRNDNSQDVNYASIVGEAIDVSDTTEDAALRFNTYSAGTSTETMVLSSGLVGIGTATPDNLLTLRSATQYQQDLKFTVGSTAVAGGFIGAGGASENIWMSAGAELTANPQSASGFTARNNEGAGAGKAAGIRLGDSAGTITFFTASSLTNGNTFTWDGGSETGAVMSILNNGNVGIGMATPSDLLHVDGGGYFEGDVVRDGGWHRGIEITTENSSYASLYFGGQSTTKYSGIIWTSSTSGNTGSARGAQIYTINTSATNSDIRFDTNNAVGSSNPTTKMVIRGDGNVGIGTITPGQRLDVINGAIRISSSGETKIFFRETIATDTYADRWTIGNDDAINNAFVFSTGANFASPKLVILDDGNVGIGINDPYSKFEVAIAPTVAATTVNETADFTDKIVISNSGTSALGDRIPLVFNIGGDGADNISTAIVGEREASGWNSALSFWVNGVTSGSEGTDAIQEAMRINSSGNVGIGTNAPSSILHLYHATSPKLLIEDTTNNVKFMAYAQNSNVHIGTNSAHDLYIDVNSSTNAIHILQSNGTVDIASSKMLIGGSAGTDGYVLTTDGSGGIAWEASPGAGSVDGSGTANRVAKWTDGDTIGNSQITDNGTSVGINQTSPNASNKLEVNGRTRIYGDLIVGDAGLGQGTPARELWIKGSGTQGIRLEDSTSSNYVFDITCDFTNGFRITDVTSSIDAFTIEKTTGHIGVGTTNPVGLFDVYSTGSDPMIVRSTSTSRATLSIRSGSTGDAQVRFQNGASSKWSIGNDGGDSDKFKIAVGSGAFAASEAVIVDTSGNLSILGTLTEASSLTIKENIEDFTPSLDIINKIRPVKYNKKKESKKEIGLIAEELAELFPELVDRDNDGNPSGVNYSRAVTVLLGGFKELYKEVQELKKRI